MAKAKLIPAAVLIPFLLPKSDSNNDLTLRTRQGPLRFSSNTEVLLTVRTHTVEHHKGQISFPGGAFESHDSSLEATALRETFEEIGLSAKHIEVVAELPEIPTVASRFTVRPYIGIIREYPAFQPSPDEISEILTVPVRHLLDPAHSKLETYERDGLHYQMRTYYYGSHRIWGATGLMLQILLEKFVSPT